jgi:hypothetical protein
MAEVIVVNGPALISVGLGSMQALESLGYSEDGVEVSLTFNTEDVRVDTFATTAFDVQHFLEEATITASLVVYDTSVLDAVKARGFGMTAGTMPAAGTLMVAQGYTYPLIVQATPNPNGVFNGACIKFPNCYCTNWSEKRGTRATRVNVTWRALPEQQVSASTGSVLWEVSCD